MAAQIYDSTIPLSWEENIAAVLFLTILLPEQREFFFKAPPPKLRILDMQLWGVCVKKCKLLQKAAVP